MRCYRCTPQIVTLANAVIGRAAKADPATALVLRSQRPAGPEPTVEVFDDDVEEAAQVARRARQYLADGIPARDLAVLFRINSQSAVLEEAFAEAGVPVVLRGTERFFDRPEVREAVTRLRGAARGEPGGLPLGEEVRAVLSTAGWTPAPPRTAGAVRERWESLAALATLADELAESLGDSLPAFVAELDTRAELQHAPVADGVTLASIHAAKGLEWPVLFVVGCSDGLLPLQYADTPAQVEEERRLAYVAITRAADRLHLSWARARQPGGRQVRSVSPFLAEALAGSAHAGDALTGGVVKRGSGKARGERARKGPARCRVCRKGLVTAQERTLGPLPVVPRRPQRRAARRAAGVAAADVAGEGSARIRGLHRRDADRHSRAVTRRRRRARGDPGHRPDEAAGLRRGRARPRPRALLIRPSSVTGVRRRP